jgi:glycerol kinase
MLMNLKSLDWDESLLKEFKIPKETLPKILNSSDDYGIINQGHLKGLKITGVIGDQQSACMGHLLNKGEVKNTYGTGCFILMNTGQKIVHSNYGLLTTVLYKGNSSVFDDSALYALEGAIETAGSAINFLKNNLKIFSDYDMLPLLYNSVENSGGVIFVPAFSGLFSPHWDNSARGLLIGLSHHTQQGHIIRATFEAISMRTYEVIQSFEKESNIKVNCLKVDGGLTSSEDFLQTQSNVLDINVERQKEKEITIIGSAIVAGLEKNVNLWNDVEELRALINVDKVYQPSWTIGYFDQLHSQWTKAVEKSKNWV